MNKAGIFDLADSAGRHARLAIGFASLVIPTLCLGLAATTLNAGPLFPAAHAAVACCYLWVAIDLFRSGSLVGDRGPNLSTLALGLALGLNVSIRPKRVDEVFGHVGWFGAGLVLLVLALGLLTLADRSPNPLVGFLARVVLVVGAPVLGVVELLRAWRGFEELQAYSLALAAVGVPFICLAAFEARLLWRSLRFARDRLR